MLAASVSKIAAENSGPKSPVDPDCDERSGDERNGVEIGHLTSRIEQREQEQCGNAAPDRAHHDFKRDEAATARTAMILCEMPLASGTSGH
jgi:hypothetical protein